MWGKCKPDYFAKKQRQVYNFEFQTKTFFLQKIIIITLKK